MNNIIGLFLGIIGVLMATETYKNYTDNFTTKIFCTTGIVLGYAGIFGNVVCLIVK